MEAPRTRLVGRDRELRALVEAFAGTRTGRGRSIVLTGPEGCGASALVAALRGELGSRGMPHRWLWTRGVRGDSAYSALVGLVTRTGQHVGVAGAVRGDVPGPTGLEALLEDLSTVPVEARPAVVGERLARALVPANPVPPLVLVVQRADALDPLAAAALATALRILAGTPTLAIATAEDPLDWPADQVLRLGRLDPADAHLLADLLADGDPDRASTLIDLSGGLPGRMVGLSRWPDPQVPAAQQLADVHPRAAGLVLVAGLADGFLPAGELAAVAGVADELLEGLAERHVLRRAAAPVAEGSERWPGPVSWDVPGPWKRAAATATPLDVQRDLATAAARALERAGAPARVRARALAHAGSPEAAGAWQAAAAQAGFDADARATYLRRAWDSLGAEAGAAGSRGTPDPGGDDSALALRCADALLAVGRTDEALEILGAALRRVPRRARARRARLLGCQHRGLLLTGDHAQAAAVLADATALLPGEPARGMPSAEPDDPETARAVAEVMTLSALAEVLTDPTRAAASAHRACRGAELAGDLATRAAAQGALAVAIGLSGRPSQAHFDAALDLADEAGDRALEARIAANRIYVQWRAGNLAGMEASVAAELARLDRTGLAGSAGGQLLVARAVALHGLGRWAELAAHLEVALTDPHRLGAHVEFLLRLVAIELAADLGRLDDARAGLADLTSHPAFTDPEVAYEVTAVRVGVAALAGDLPRGPARAMAAQALSQAEGIAGDPFAAARVRVAALRLLARAEERLGGPLDVSGAGARADPGPGSLPTDDRMDLPAELRALYAEEAALRSGEVWEAAIDAWDVLPMPYRGAWARVAAAHAEAGQGRMTAALGLVDAAADTARTLGAAPLLAAAERLARQLGRRSGRSQGALTSRERDVVAEVARGRTNREIAGTLGMSERTVAVHLGRIFAKLGAGTRGEAVILARHHGEIP